MEATKLFKQNERLLYKQSWYYAVRYNMDFDDIKSQAFLIFCEALERPYRSSFTTFLFHRLRTLNDFCKREKKIIYSYSEIEKEQCSVQTNTTERIAFFQSLEHLSSDGRHVVHGILKGKFEKPELQRQRPVGKYRIKEVTTREWGWSCERVEKVWDELKKWWINSN